MSEHSKTQHEGQGPWPGDDPTRPPPPSGLKAFLQKYIWWVGGIFGVLLITGMRPFMVHRPPPPPIDGHVPDFELVDQRGETFTEEDMRGKVWVVGFVFTRCQSLCPPVSAAMIRMQEHIDRSRIADDVHLLTITVDPEHDTPEVLAGYADQLGAHLDSWSFVTGDASAIEALVVGGFKLAIGEKKEEAGVFDIAHSSRLALVDRNGAIRGTYTIDDAGLEELYQRAIAVRRVKLQGPDAQ